MHITETFFYETIRKLMTGVRPSSLPYDSERDGPYINPSLKILGDGANSLQDGRWEIFTLLIDENDNLGLRSGVKSVKPPLLGQFKSRNLLLPLTQFIHN